METDSSSSEDEKERCREALDIDFSIKDISNKSEAENIANKEEPLPSLRNPLPNKTGGLNPFTIKVSAEFQKYVSKHLSKILDESIVHVEKKVKIKKKKEVLSGIKLLKNSKNYVLPFENNSISILPKRKIFKKKLKNEDLQQRALEVAVSSEWVLSQVETKYWDTNSRGEVEIVKN